jgi:phage terminase large subunit-like protein
MTLNSSQPLPYSEAALLAILEREQARRQSHRRLTEYRPYAKQREFHAAGKVYRERLLMAGNQLGKTLSAGAETAMHACGRYPDWWEGHVKDRPFHAWVSGVTGESTRDNPQRILYGPLGSPGTGMIPKDAIKDVSPRRGLADAVDTMVVKFGGGGDVQSGDTIIGFKSYDQGREKWQGPTLGLVWFDEEPPEDIYTEGMTRTNVGLCPVYITFTPLQGMTDVVKRFVLDKVPGTHVTSMTIHDVEHYTPEQREAIISSYPAHERKARTQGIPQLGSGRVFPIDEDEIKVKPFEIPSHWTYIAGIDFGWDHPSAGIKLAWDRDSDCVYVIAAHRAREQTPVMFAASVRSWGANPDGSQWLPWAWPHDGLQHDKGSGEQLATQYRSQGLRMLPLRATFEDGSFGVEAGVAEMFDRMQTGRFKVFEQLNDWFEEFRLYHRKDGLIVKKGDDLISATRYAMMMRRHAIQRAKAAPQQQPMRASSRSGWMS